MTFAAAWLPPGATDTHVHVACPAASPAGQGDSGTFGRYRQEIGALGFSRTVFIQSGRYGFDNACMLAAIAASGNAARGVAALRPEAADTDLRALHAAGVRGIRLTDLSDAAAPLDALETMAARIAPLGWHAALLVEPDQLEALLPRLAGLPVPVVIDHAGRLRRCRSDLAEGERALLALAALPGCWVKISAAEYLSAAGGAFADLDGLVRRLADATPRLLWGSDWPHPSTVRTGAAVPRPEALLAALVRWFPDPAARRRLLVDNPAAVYGFR